jgi:hypothetical protein
MPKEVDGEIYFNGTEAAEFIGSDRQLFYTNVAPQLIAYQVGASKRAYYRKRDLLPFRGARPAPAEREAPNQ